MVQPYVASVDERGETKMVFVDGRFSHALRVGALLDADAGVLDVPWEKPVAVAVVEPSRAEVDRAEASWRTPAIGSDLFSTPGWTWPRRERACRC